MFILLDRPDEERDRLLSEHVMNIHAKRKRRRTNSSNTTNNKGAAATWSTRADDRQWSEADQQQPARVTLAKRLMESAFEFATHPIPIPVMRKFIAYAKRYIHPRLSLDAARLLQRKYLEMREAAEASAADGIPITTRQLESLLRLAQARAKADLAPLVTVAHAQDVVDIMQECLLDTLTTEDGNLDFGRSGGMSLAKKVKAFVARLTQAAQRRNSAVFAFDELLDVADAMALQVDDFRDFVDILNNECYLLKKGPREYKLQLSSYSQR